MPTIGEALSALEEELCVGREPELVAFQQWLTTESAVPVLLDVYGRAAWGKVPS